MWDKHNNILNLWNKAIGVDNNILSLWNQTMVVGKTQQHLKSCEIKQLVWDKHNNILNLWNKAIGVGQTQQHLKPVK